MWGGICLCPVGMEAAVLGGGGGGDFVACGSVGDVAVVCAQVEYELDCCWGTFGGDG